MATNEQSSVHGQFDQVFKRWTVEVHKHIICLLSTDLDDQVGDEWASLVLMQTVVHLNKHAQDKSQVLECLVEHAWIGVQKPHREPLQNKVKVTNRLIRQRLQALRKKNQGYNSGSSEIVASTHIHFCGTFTLYISPYWKALNSQT